MIIETAGAAAYVAGLYDMARAAQRRIEYYDQRQVDELVTALAWEAVKPGNAERFAIMGYEETKLGDYEGKLRKLAKKTRGVLWEMQGAKSVGIIETDHEKGLVKIAKPVGVIGAILPCTNPCVTLVLKTMWAVKGRNGIVLAPHPRAKKTAAAIAEALRSALARYGAPEDLIQCVAEPDVVTSGEVMRQADLVVATGGSAMVKAAYSCGRPAYGVGVGNAVSVIDETADIGDAAHKIMLSKTNDLATGCSTENSIVVQKSVYAEMLAALEKEGGRLLDKSEKERLQSVMWKDGKLSSGIVAQSAATIAGLAGIDITGDKTFLIVEETGSGAGYPFSGEKMSVVLTAYSYDGFDGAIAIVNANQEYMGAGHSCGIHSFSEEHILELATRTRTSRVMVRQAQNYGNAGDWCNGMPWTTTLGCGTWGGNIVSENITWKHMINTTWVSYPLETFVPSDEELFGKFMVGQADESN